MVVAMIAGYIAALGIVGLTTAEFEQGVRLFYGNFDVAYGLVKSASFGFAVSLIGCMAGLQGARRRGRRRARRHARGGLLAR